MAPSAQRRSLADPHYSSAVHNAANIGERKTWTQSEFYTWQNSVKGYPKMYTWCTSPADGQRSCKVWLASGERRRRSNEAKTRNPLKFAGVSETPEPISAASAPKFAILRGHLKKILLFNKFFSDCRYMPSCLDIAQHSCAMVNRWQFLRPIFPGVACRTFQWPND